MYNTVGRDHFPGVRESAEAPRDIEGRAAEAAVDPDRLARIDPDAHVEGQIGIESTFLFEADLELDGRSKGLARRSEDCKRLVSAQLDDCTAARADGVPGDRGEPLRQPRRCFVPPLLREARVAADVGDQEGTNLGFWAEVPALALVSAL
jgi:hypothetical protein